jgi:two-component system, chemotaxis family, protein-glutamate methylesterase/glutaminase
MALRVLIVDDSIFVRNVLNQMISSDPDLEVMGQAANGKAALEFIEKEVPDIMTLDVEMPIMNGIETIKAVLKKWKIPIIMISSLTSQGASVTLEALSLGAADFIQKPEGVIPLELDKIKDDLIKKIKVLTGRRGAAVAARTPSVAYDAKPAAVKPAVGATRDFKIVTIGISTGGPKSLSKMLIDIPKDINAAYVVVQHMPKTFTGPFAKRLNDICQVRVKEAENGDVVRPGIVYIAPGDQHLLLTNKNNVVKLKTSDDSKMSGHRPSADVLFYSAAQELGRRIIGVIMTGMGSDGAKSIQKIKEFGGATIAQDEASCVVFGMPKVAIELGHVDSVVSLDDINNEIYKHLK